MACYKNKVLDYRAGLETDLSEVLQTSNIHVFTNVAKGQFAAAADLKKCFGETATQDEIAVQILKQGKSLQVSEAERAQLYDNTLTQICTWMAANCHHPVTGKPYTASQIRHALTTSGGGVAEGGSSSNSNSNNTPADQQQQPQQQQQKQQQQHQSSNNKKSKKKNKNKKQNNDKNEQQQEATAVQQFTVQPHKPIKQQYLAALKYLQAADILPIQRASMRLQWQYPASQQEAVTEALQDLDIAASSAVEENATATSTTERTTDSNKTLILTVDPAVYRPLHEIATQSVPGSTLEILQQQVFQAVATAAASQQATAAAKKTTTTKATSEENHDSKNNNNNNNSKESKSEEAQSHKSASKQNDDESSSSSSSEDLARLQISRKNQRKAKKKQQKKAQRQLREDGQSSSSCGEEDDTENAPETTTNRSQQQDKIPAPDETTNVTAAAAAAPGAKTCNTCVGAANAFATAAEYRAHFRSDWHRFNQKLKLQGAAAISLEEFRRCDSESFFATTSEN